MLPSPREGTMKPTKRTRQSTPRSRNGCATCRQRHYKCDEEAPECRQCRVAGWQCPGYPPRDSSLKLTSHNIISKSRSTTPDMPITQYALAYKVPGTQHERRSLHHFTNFAATDMSGPLSEEFWSRAILQRCQHEAPLRHAAVALGQIHVEYISTPKTSDFTPGNAAIEAYGKAVKSLRSYMGKADPDRTTVLMCSAVFFCFDLMRGEYSASLRHLKSALKILKTWRRELSYAEGTDEFNEHDELLAVFARMDIEATFFDDDRAPVLRLEGVDMLRRPLMHRMDERDLHRRLLMLSHTALLFLVQGLPYKSMDFQRVPQVVKMQRKQLIQRFDAWELQAKQHNASMETDHDESEDRRRYPAISTLHCRIIRLLLYHCLRDDQAISISSYDDEATILLEEAETTLPSYEKGRRSFSLGSGTIAPIFLLALKTKRRDIRERALKILRSLAGRREGFYDAHTMANIVVGLEREAAEVECTVALEHTAEAVMDDHVRPIDAGEENLARMFALLELGS